MANVTPVWTDLVTVIADAAITRPNIATATLDLRTKFGAYVFCRVGRVGTTALTTGIQFRVNRVPSNNGVPWPASLAPLGPGLTAATNGNTTVNTDSNSGQRVLQVAAITNFAVGDYVIVGSGTARQEYCRVARIDGGTVDLIMDRNLAFTHTAAQADTVRNKCDVWPPVWLPGGSVYEIIADYEASTTGDNNRVEVLAQTYDSDLLA